MYGLGERHGLDFAVFSPAVLGVIAVPEVDGGPVGGQWIGKHPIPWARPGSHAHAMYRVARWCLAPLAAGSLLLIAACTDSSNTSPPPPDGTAVASPAAGTTTTLPPATVATVDGTWQGKWVRTSAPQGSGTMTFVLHQQGQSVTGTVAVAASACLTTGPVTGSVSGTAVTLHATTPAVGGGPQATGDYTGTLSGTKLSGKLTVTCAAGTGVGTWDLIRN